MIKVEIIRAVHWNGEHWDVGAVLSVKEFDANWLISRGKAVVYVDRNSLENRSVALENSPQPKLTKRTWKRSSSSVS